MFVMKMLECLFFDGLLQILMALMRRQIPLRISWERDP